VSRFRALAQASRLLPEHEGYVEVQGFILWWVAVGREVYPDCVAVFVAEFDVTALGKDFAAQYTLYLTREFGKGKVIITRLHGVGTIETVY